MARSRSDSLLLPLEPVKPDFTSERKLMRSGVEYIVGIDEMRRGAVRWPARWSPQR